MRYVAARIRSEAVTFKFRNYLADSIYYYARGQAVNARFMEMLDNDKNKKENTRTGEEVFAEIVEKAGLEVRS